MNRYKHLEPLILPWSSLQPSVYSCRVAGDGRVRDGRRCTVLVRPQDRGDVLGETPVQGGEGIASRNEQDQARCLGTTGSRQGPFLFVSAPLVHRVSGIDVPFVDVSTSTDLLFATGARQGGRNYLGRDERATGQLGRNLRGHQAQVPCLGC